MRCDHPPHKTRQPGAFQVKKGTLDRSIFDGSTINTPSMLCVEDYIDAL